MADSSGNSGIRAEVARPLALLRKDNYRAWSSKVKAQLKVMDCWRLVLGGGAVGTDAQEVQQTPPKMRSENWITIADQGVWQAVGPDHMLKKKSCHVRRRHRFCRSNEVCLFCESVDHHKDNIMIVTGRQIRDPVEGHAAPRPGRDRKKIQESVRRMPDHLVALAGVAAADEAVDSCGETWPLEIL